MAISANNWLDFSDVLEWQREHLKHRVTSVHDEIPLGKLPYSTCKRPIWGDVQVASPRLPSKPTMPLHQLHMLHKRHLADWCRIITIWVHESHETHMFIFWMYMHWVSFSWPGYCYKYVVIISLLKRSLFGTFVLHGSCVCVSFPMHWSVVTFSPQHRGTWLVATRRGTESHNGVFVCFEDSLSIP